MSQQFKEGDRVVADHHPDYPRINGRPGTVISVTSRGLFIEIPPDTTLYHVTANEITYFALCNTPIIAPSLQETDSQLSVNKWISPEEVELVSATQIRSGVDSEAIARYAELMQASLWDFDRHPLPVLFVHEGRYLVGDGHHRIEAARKIRADIQCEIFTANLVEEAILYSVIAIENSNHGIPLRPKDQRKRITMFLDLLESNTIRIDRPDGFDLWSSRAIATYLRLPESGYRTVATIRKERELAKELERKKPISLGEIYENIPHIAPKQANPFGVASTLENPSVKIAQPPLVKSSRMGIDETPQILSPVPTSPSDICKAEIDRDILKVAKNLYRMSNDQLATLKKAIKQEEKRRL